tara:strand:- start:1745 stop:1924 length:180 start_codon:yes stop_codon:yes gene_type:complete
VGGLKECGAKLAPHSFNKFLFERISRAESWLKTNTYSTATETVRPSPEVKSWQILGEND